MDSNGVAGRSEEPDPESNAGSLRLLEDSIYEMEEILYGSPSPEKIALEQARAAYRATHPKKYGEEAA